MLNSPEVDFFLPIDHVNTIWRYTRDYCISEYWFDLEVMHGSNEVVFQKNFVKLRIYFKFNSAHVFNTMSCQTVQILTYSSPNFNSWLNKLKVREMPAIFHYCYLPSDAQYMVCDSSENNTPIPGL